MDAILFFVSGLLFGGLFGAVGALGLVLIWQRLFGKRPTKRPPKPLTEAEQREMEIQRRELDNFMKYEGYELTDPRKNY